jgi:hypothetical protein
VVAHQIDPIGVPRAVSSEGQWLRGERRIGSV